jgi:oligopeptidase A
MSTSMPSALLEGHGLPCFEQITPDLVQQDIPVLLAQLEQQFTELETTLQSRLDSGASISWDEVMQPMQRIGERLRWSWGVISHLNGVCNSPELREAHAAQQPEVVRLSNRLGQSKVLHQVLCRLRDEPNEPHSATRQRILDSELLSMQQRGVGLDGEHQIAFNQASERLAALSTSFGNQNKHQSIT